MAYLKITVRFVSDEKNDRSEHTLCLSDVLRCIVLLDRLISLIRLCQQKKEKKNPCRHVNLSRRPTRAACRQKERKTKVEDNADDCTVHSFIHRRDSTERTSSVHRLIFSPPVSLCTSEEYVVFPDLSIVVVGGRGKRKDSVYILDSMNRPLFRARNLDPSKRIRLFVDQHDDNNNDLTQSSTPSTSSNNLLVSHSSTSTSQTSQSASQLPQRSIPQMPFVSGMEREEEAVHYLSYFLSRAWIAAIDLQQTMKGLVRSWKLLIKSERGVFLTDASRWRKFVTAAASFRNIIFKVLSTLNNALVQRRFELSLFLTSTKMPIVNRSIQPLSSSLSNSYDYNVGTSLVRLHRLIDWHLPSSPIGIRWTWLRHGSDRSCMANEI